MNLTIGQEVAGYRILAVLGKGGMGVVYRARDVGLDRDVALKVIKPELTRDEKSVRRFQREARVLAKLKNPNIVGVHELRHTDEGFFIVMEYVDGGDLSVLLQGVPLPISKTLSITRQLLQAFEKAHSAGVIHRDIKPQNIMISSTGEVKVTDFGLAKLSSPETMITVTSGILGTMNYMSPEQLRGDELDHRTDLWSLGVVLYEMLFGRLPFEAPYEAALMYTILNEEVEIPIGEGDKLPRGLAQLVLKVFQKKREMRFQSASEMLRDLDRIIERSSSDEDSTISQPIPPPETRQREPVSAPKARPGVKALVTSIAAIVLLTIGYLLYPIIMNALSGGGKIGSPSSAFLSLVTVPNGADVVIDEQHIGQTPVIRYPLAANDESTSVKIQHDGFVTVDTTLQAGLLHEVLLTAIPEPIKPTVDEGFSTGVETGDGSGERTGDGTPDDDRPAVSEEEERIAVELLIVPSDRSTMSIDGGARQAPGSAMLTPGEHSVTFRSSTYGAFETRFTVSAEEPLSLICFFERDVGVSSGSTWGVVTDNGEIVYRPDGNPETTPTQLSLGPGSHSISVMKYEHKAELVQGASGPITITPSCKPSEPYMLVFELIPE